MPPVFNSGDTIYFPFDTYNSAGASVTITDLAVTDLEVYKNGSITQRASDNGYALLDTDGIDFDGSTGLHGFSIDTSDNSDSGFWADGSQYWVHLNAVTVDGQTVKFTYFLTLGYLLRPTTAGRKLDVSSGGEAGVDWANVGSPTTTLNLSGTTVKTATDVETDTQDIQSRLPAALLNGKMQSTDACASGTADSGDVNFLIDTERTETPDDYWVGSQIKFTSGSNVGLTRLINGFNSGTDQISWTPDLPAAVAAGVTYEILPNGRVDLAMIRGTQVASYTFGGSAFIGANVEGVSNDFFVAARWESMLDGTAGETLTANITGNLVGNVTGGINTAAGTIQTLDALDTAQDTQHGTTQAAVADVPTNAELATALGTADDATLAAITALSIPTTSQITAAMLAAAYEGAETLQEFLRLARAALMGKSDGFPDGPVHFRDKADTKNRLTANVDTDGNRSAITTDAT